MYTTELAYRRTAAQGATGFGLLVALYDTLAGDLRRAAEADCENKIEKRCDAINHALLVIGHLEDWVNQGSGGELADQLVSFYSNLRRKMIEAQAKRSVSILEQQIERVLHLRRVWQNLDLPSASPMEIPSWFAETSLSSEMTGQFESRSSSWTA